MKSNNKVIRILHVVGGMNRAGSETWLMNVLRNIDRSKFQMDFLVHTHNEYSYTKEILALGSNIIVCPKTRYQWEYNKKLKSILSEKRYDVVHSHLNYFNGYVLKIAYNSGVKARICHSHSDFSVMKKNSSIFRKLYIKLMENYIKKYMSKGIAVSEGAAKSLFGVDWRENEKVELLHCGIDLLPFQEEINIVEIRKEFNISENTFVICHIGRFVEVKNHHYLIDILAEVLIIEPDTKLILIGAGPLKSVIEKYIIKKGLTDKVLFTGERSDIPRLLLGLMDIFVMPSIYEGLPLVGIEVQSAGVPMLISDNITKELDIGDSIVNRLPVSQSPKIWADQVLRMRIQKNRNIIGLQNILESNFNIIKCNNSLIQIYNNALL